MLNFTPERWDYEYRHQIFEQFIAIPGAIECIRNGLEQIFDYYEPSVAKEKFRVVFELVQRTGASSGTGTADLGTGVDHQLAQAS